MELITEPKATLTGTANGLDLQIKLHLPRFLATDLIYLKSRVSAPAIRLTVFIKLRIELNMLSLFLCHLA